MCGVEGGGTPVGGERDTPLEKRGTLTLPDFIHHLPRPCKPAVLGKKVFQPESAGEFTCCIFMNKNHAFVAVRVPLKRKTF